MSKLPLLMLCAAGSAAAIEEVEVSVANPQGWQAVNVRTDAMVELSTFEPLFGDGSLLFATNTQTNGQDKADYQLSWQQSSTGIDFPDRTLGTLSQLSYAWYRDAMSTTTAHFTPVLRLNFYDDGGTPGAVNAADDVLGVLVWEGVYNGFTTPPTDTWKFTDTIEQNFWAFVSFNPSGTTGVIQNFNATLTDWQNGAVTGQGGDPIITLSANTFITGINVGVGSGWGNSFTGYVDTVRVAFGNQDDQLFNFEVCATFAPNSNPDVIFDNSFECYKML